MEYLNVYVTETYNKDGKEKTQYHRVGTAFPHSKGNGISIELIPGVSISGKAVAFPPREDSESK